jgi:hypothetical protein
VVRKIGRAWSGTIEGITEILRERGGDEPIKTWGYGKKYGGQPYVQKFKAVMVGDTCPGVEVELKRADAMVDPERIAIFKTADGILPAVIAYDQILEVPNPQQMYDDMRQEKIDTEQTNLLPDVRIGALKRELAVAKEEADLQWQIQKIKDEAEHETGLKQTALDLSQMPSEVIEAKQRAFLEQKMQEASQPPQGRPGMNSPAPITNSMAGPPPPMPNGSGPFTSGPGGPMPGMPPGPPTGPGSPPSGVARPPMPMQGPPRPLMPMQVPRPLPMPVPPPGMVRRVATAPGQAQQPIQPISRFMPPGGVGTTGVGPRLVGPQGLPGQPVALPNIQAANQAVAPIGPLPTVGLGKQRNGKRRRAGK